MHSSARRLVAVSLLSGCAVAVQAANARTIAALAPILAKWPAIRVKDRKRATDGLLVKGNLGISILSVLLGACFPVQAHAFTDAEAYRMCAYWASLSYLPGVGPCTLMPIPADWPYAGYPSYGYPSRDYGVYYAGPILGQNENEFVDRTKGGGSSSQCGVSNIFVNDPVNPLNGNEFLTELDYNGHKGLSFSRYYNSLLGTWTYSYSRNLFIIDSRHIDLTKDNGEKISFVLNADSWQGVAGGGTLSQVVTSWIYSSTDGEVSYFDKAGRLTRVLSKANDVLITNSSGVIKLKSSMGDTGVLMSAGFGYPLRSASFSGVTLSYQTNAQSNFTKAIKNLNGKELERNYIYESTANLSLLTGVVDERGVRVLTVTYDAQDRAIATNTAGVGSISIAYNDGGVSVLTNEYGKKTTYHTAVFEGVRRIISIVGEPTPDCPASDTSYTYNTHGQILTKTDAKGLITTYTYNDRGLETSRTEASGTPLARTVTTEWGGDRFLPVRIVEPDRITVYNYDAQGRELSRRTTSR